MSFAFLPDNLQAIGRRVIGSVWRLLNGPIACQHPIGTQTEGSGDVSHLRFTPLAFQFKCVLQGPSGHAETRKAHFGTFPIMQSGSSSPFATSSSIQSFHWAHLRITSRVVEKIDTEGSYPPSVICVSSPSGC